MLNNYWEELKMTNISELHDKVIAGMNVPKWMNELKCPYCGKIQPLRSIRSFGLKLNSRNIGDLFVDLCCYECKSLNTLYFRSETKNIGEVIKILTEKTPATTPLIEEEMYAQRYNNLLEWGLKEDKGKTEEIKCP